MKIPAFLGSSSQRPRDSKKQPVVLKAGIYLHSRHVYLASHKVAGYA
jgi:hypothetical protein